MKMASAWGKIGLLPIEMRQKIMGLLDPKSLLEFIITSSTVKSEFLSCEGVICHASIQQIVPKANLQLAVARYMADVDYNRQRTRARSEYEDHAVRFSLRHLRGQAKRLSIPITSFSLKMIRQLSDFHRVVMDLCDDFEFFRDEACLITLLDRADTFTSTEYARAIKAFYLHELARLVIPLHDDGEHDRSYSTFWACFSPWEAEQAHEVHCNLYQRMLSLLHDESDEYMGLVIDVLDYATTHFGLRRVHSLLNKDELDEALYVYFARQARNPLPETYRRGIFHQYRCNRFRIWLRRVEDSGGKAMYSLSAADTHQYGDEDSGPRDSWYCRLLHSIPEMINKSSVNELYTQWKQEAGAVSRAGCSFLSRQTWDSRKGLLPTMEDMESEFGSKWLGEDGKLMNDRPRKQ